MCFGLNDVCRLESVPSYLNRIAGEDIALFEAPVLLLPL